MVGRSTCGEARRVASHRVRKHEKNPMAVTPWGSSSLRGWRGGYAAVASVSWLVAIALVARAAASAALIESLTAWAPARTV